MRYQGKYFAPSQRKPVAVSGILTRIAALLLCFVTASACMMSGLLAKYSTTGSGSDEARVAKFDVEVVGVPDNVEIVCTTAVSDNGSYTITVTNKSEVAVEYDMTVTYANAISGVSAKIDGNTGTVNDLSTTFSDVGKLPVGESTANHVLTFTVDWNEFTKEITGTTAEKTLNFSVTINVVQID